MERRDKDSSLLFYELAFLQITKYVSYPYLNLVLTLLHYLFLLSQFYQIVYPHSFDNLIPFFTVFIVLGSLLVAFLLLTLVSYNFQVLATIWVYSLLLLQTFSVMYIQTTLQCFRGSGWCQGDPKLQIGSLAVLAIFAVLVIWLRSYCYCPLHQTNNPLSMTSGRPVLYIFFYASLTVIVSNGLLTQVASAEKQLAFVINLIFFALTRTPFTSNPLMSRLIFILSSAVLWTSGLIWIMPLIQQVIGTNSGSIWYYWGFSIPVVLGITYTHSSSFNKGYQWQSLFFQDEQNINLRDLFLKVNQLVKAVAVIKKSELKTNSPQFRTLWGLIMNHNQKCNITDCPLNILKNLKVERQDDILEQKRYTKTIEKTLEFALQLITNKHDIYPNLLELNLEIANFQLQVFHLRTKGLQLYNKHFRKSSSEINWGIYYLKRKIEGFQTTGEAGSSQREEDVAAFKHGIQVSVTMLAQFWYFLSDPKCNIKKLYDLTNQLFPHKIGVDQAWQSVKQLRNIECYYLYAKYLIRMFNDKEKGLKILQQAKKIEAAARDKEQIQSNSEANHNEQMGVIFLQFDGKNSGVMYQVNSACEKMFGYNKGELQGRKVNDIMPKIIAVYHDKILENYQQTNKPKMMNKDRSVWGKSKDGSLFPFTICIKPVRNYFSQTSQVYASLKRDLWLKEKAFFFADSELNISDLSASMFALFPDVASRIHLKKKIHLEQIMANYQTILPLMVQNRQTHEIAVERTFSLAPEQNYTQTISFGVQAEEVQIGVAGSIGYYFKVFKGGGFTSLNESQMNKSSNMQSQSAQQPLNQKRKDFQFIPSTQDSGKKLLFQGGITKKTNLFRTQVLSKISCDIENERQNIRRQIQGGAERIDYGKDIITKRLFDGVVSDIFDMSEASGMDGDMEDENMEEEGGNTENLKPSDLNSILQRQVSNKPIFFLKLLTVIMLAVGTFLSALQYAAYYSNRVAIADSFKVYSSMSSLHAQIMFLNIFATRLTLNNTTPADLATFAGDVNLLDSKTAAIPLSVETNLTYSDGSQQQMLLAFAVNKLISEAQIIASGSTKAAQLFFLQYNGVNGLDVGCEKAQQFIATQLSSEFSQSAAQSQIYLIIFIAVFSTILIIKNCVLKRILQKKNDILNVFFEIPRCSCTAIQKECEKFIQRLSLDNDEDEIQLEALQEEQETSSRGQKKKKRTIMGEEKTSTYVIIVSLFMLALLLTYPLIEFSLDQGQTKKNQFAVNAIIDLVKMEKQLIKTISYIETHITQTTYPLGLQDNATAAITTQFNYVFSLLSSLTSKFFALGSIFDQTYLDDYNSLFFDSLCTSTTACLTSQGEDRGLNNILLNYYDYVIGKYQAVMSANGTYNLTVLYPPSSQLQQDNFRKLMQKHWRKLEEVAEAGGKRVLLAQDTLYFSVMLGVCILNCTVLLWAWMTFYSSLQKKIVATEYILTFIPLDEINRNPKIVKYIRQQILRDS